jgi:hypothetical protein
MGKVLMLQITRVSNVSNPHINYAIYESEELFTVDQPSSEGSVDLSHNGFEQVSDTEQAEKICQVLSLFSRKRSNKMLVCTLNGYNTYEIKNLRVYKLVLQFLLDESNDLHDSIAYDFFLKHSF